MYKQEQLKLSINLCPSTFVCAKTTLLDLLVANVLLGSLVQNVFLVQETQQTCKYAVKMGSAMMEFTGLESVSAKIQT